VPATAADGDTVSVRLLRPLRLLPLLLLLLLPWLMLRARDAQRLVVSLPVVPSG